ncbi:hypothetical protein CSKR_108538 [Clonorchis sinensis]|uniref:Uncharacterized protein n=1 Tax=Clonorchis sinensis TaxID=79923 RepID=A0A3R7F7L5_CLOSI|nr:hypothetical protein CSKR_108538 [Clonorchis sinensis]
MNIHLLLERVFLNFTGYSLTVTQMQANAAKRLRQFLKRYHFSRDAKRIYGKTYYSHASSVVSTVTLVQILNIDLGLKEPQIEHVSAGWNIQIRLLRQLLKSAAVTRSPRMSDAPRSNSGMTIEYALLMSSNKSGTRVQCLV